MAITVNLRYKGKNGSALAFAKKMTESGTVDLIRAEDGNLKYEYYQSLDDPETILLIDSWRDQKAIDIHHASPHDANHRHPAGKIRPAHDCRTIHKRRNNRDRREIYPEIKK